MNTAAEAIRALSLQMPGFRRQMNEGWYQIRIRGEDTAPEAVYARLHEPLGEGAVIHIVPRLAGAGKGGLQIVLGQQPSWALSSPPAQRWRCGAQP
ncbi:phage tail assembly protein [Escherichia coli O157:H7]|nr:phage tail assembly protein [Escherichia coli O157:H7]